jgi:uncharacterized protein YdaU (DUF1376 family)
MAKDPALLWYPSDWISGTIGMTLEQKGAYMELLMMQFSRGHMTSHMIGQVVGQLWVNVQDKFKQDDNGLWFNERLDIEKEKRKKFTESRRNNVSGENQHTKKGKVSTKKINHMNGHMTSHMENVNENTNNNVLVLSEVEIGKTIEFIKITGQRLLTSMEVMNYWQAFLIHSKDDFHLSNGDMKKHFRNWIKKQPYEINKRIATDASKPGTIREPM